MRFCLRQLFIPLLFGIGQSLPGQSPDWEVRLDHWRELIRAGEPGRIIDSCRAVLPHATDKGTSGAILTVQGSAERSLGQYRQALKTHRRALAYRQAAFGAQSEQVAAVYQNIGNCYFDLDMPVEAEQYYDRSLRIKKAVFGENDPKVAATLYNLANLYLEIGRTEAAEAAIGQALRIVERVHGSQSPALIDYLMTLSTVQSVAAREDEAGSSLQRALQIQLDSVGEQHPDVARLHNQLGLCFYRSGDFDQALPHLHRAVTLIMAFAGTDPAIIGAYLLNEGACLQRIGDYRGAAERYRLAYGYVHQPLDQASVLHNLGAALRNAGELVEARQAFHEAINVLATAPASVERQLLDAHLQFQSGACFQDWDRPDIALVFYQKALALYRAVPGSEGRQVRMLNQMGLANLHMGKYAAAEALFHRARSGAAASREPIIALMATGNLAETALQRRDVAGALKWLHQSEQWLQAARLGLDFPFEDLQVNAFLVRAYLLAARESRDRNQWRQVLRYAGSAVERMADLRSGYRAEESGWALQHQFYDVFNAAAEAALALGQEREALHWVERGKEEGLRRLSRGYVRLHSRRLSSRQVMEQQAQMLQIEAARKRLHDVQALLLPGEPSLRLDSMRRALEALERRFSASDRFADELPELSIATAQRRLQTDEVFVSYAFVENRLMAFVLSPDTLRAVLLPAGNSLPEQVEQFTRLCSINPEWLTDAAREQAKAALLQSGYALYRVLLEPLGIEPGRRLLLAPDGCLAILPFEALLTEPSEQPAYRFRSHPYLMRRHAVSYQQSIGHWLSLRARGAARTPNRVLTMAPTFNNHPAGLSELTHNLREAEAVKATMGGVLVSGEEARKAYFLQHAGRYRYLFLATHGYMQHRFPEYSFIAFAGHADSLDQSLLYQAELAQLPLDADLMVLSACQTAAGKLYRGEGLISLVNACHQAGVRAVMASLWNVDDQQTPLIMAAFFDHLRKGMNKAEALRAAQEHYVRREASHDKAHPFFWAGFIASGDERPLPQLPGRYIRPLDWAIRIGPALLALAALLWAVNKWPRRP